MGGPLFSSGIFLPMTSTSSISSLLNVCGLHFTVLDLRACHAWKGCVPPPPHISFPGTGAANKQEAKMVPIFSFFSHESSFEPPSTPLTLSASHTSVASSYLQNPNVTKSHAINMNYLSAFGPIPFTF
jgi:hypothetical protein